MNRQSKALAIIMVFGLTGCGSFSGGGFSLNPFNWFSSGEEVETLPELEAPAYSDRRPLVDTVTSLAIERTPGGAIVRATGLPPTQGYHTANLVAENDGEPIDGILTYTFRVLPPEAAQRVSTVQSREIIVGKFISQIVLSDVREIRVVGASNIRSARR